MGFRKRGLIVALLLTSWAVSPTPSIFLDLIIFTVPSVISFDTLWSHYGNSDTLFYWAEHLLSRFTAFSVFISKSLSDSPSDSPG